VAVRNRFTRGDQLELIGPAMKHHPFICGNLLLQEPGNDGVAVEVVHPNQRITIAVPASAAPLDLIRRADADALSSHHPEVTGVKH